MTAARQMISTAIFTMGLLLVATGAGADVPSRIDELFSSADGQLQFIQLSNVSPSQLAGLVLTTAHDGITQTFVFPATSNLPNPPFIDEVLIVSRSLSQRRFDGPDGGATEWDYVVPDGFLPLSGGIISLGSADRWDYGSIPADGYSALYRSGAIGVYSANSSAHGAVVTLGFGDERFEQEYVNDSADRHFFTSFDAEIAALESGRIPGWRWLFQGWQGGTGFGGYARRVAVLDHAVCRFYLPPPDDSHFFTASEEECAGLRTRSPYFVLETDAAFYAGLPDAVTGACAPGLGPLYRLWNPATNDHWFTADTGIRQMAMTQGYVAEGYGDDGVAMCVLRSCFGNAC